MAGVAYSAALLSCRRVFLASRALAQYQTRFVPLKHHRFPAVRSPIVNWSCRWFGCINVFGEELSSGEAQKLLLDMKQEWVDATRCFRINRTRTDRGSWMYVPHMIVISFGNIREIRLVLPVASAEVVLSWSVATTRPSELNTCCSKTSLLHNICTLLEWDVVLEISHIVYIMFTHA